MSANPEPVPGFAGVITEEGATDHVWTEIELAYKARNRRPKDDPDFEATLPILTPARRDWLRRAISTLAPDHHWLDRL